MDFNPLAQFAIKNLKQMNVLGFDLSFTNSSLAMFITFGVFFCLVHFLSNSLKLYTNKKQVILEMFYSMSLSILEGNAGKKSIKYAPFIFTLFLFIMGSNMFGLIPIVFTPTSHFIVTFGLSIFIFISINIIGFYNHGLKFFGIFMPKGTPIAVAPLLIVIELFSYLARPISLSVRLTANMIAGHVILKVLAAFCVMAKIFSIFPFAMLTIITGFEILVAFLQSYIFAVLACVYLSDALNLH